VFIFDRLQWFHEDFFNHLTGLSLDFGVEGNVVFILVFKPDFFNFLFDEIMDLSRQMDCIFGRCFFVKKRSLDSFNSFREHFT